MAAPPAPLLAGSATLNDYDNVHSLSLAVDVSGHEIPVFVGSSRNITCTAHVSVTRMEWLLAGVREPIEEREDGGKSLTLPLSPNNTQLNGAKFTCRVTTASGRTIEETLTADIRG